MLEYKKKFYNDMANKWLTIPKNEVGMEEYENGIEGSENIISFTIPENEFNALWDVFDSINEKYDLLIDDFESEIIPAEIINDVIELVSKEKFPTFYEALILAEKYNSFLALDF